MQNVLDDLTFRLFGRLIARQFVVFGGVSAALKLGSCLVAKGITPTYSRVDEHVRRLEHIDGILASYIIVGLRMDTTNQGNLAIKPSAFGMEYGPRMFARKLSYLAGALKGKLLELEIDAENRETLAAVQDVLNTLAPKLPYGITFRPAFQMHLPEGIRRELIARYHILDMPIRIVKGSGLYNVGSEEVSNDEVLTRYEETFRLEIVNGKHPNIATVHDRKLVESLTAIAMRERVSLDQFTVQFLDGPFGRSLERDSLALGNRVGRYITFVDPSAPDEWKGYVRRRIAFGRKLIFGR